MSGGSPERSRVLSSMLSASQIGLPVTPCAEQTAAGLVHRRHRLQQVQVDIGRVQAREVGVGFRRVLRRRCLVGLVQEAERPKRSRNNAATVRVAGAAGDFAGCVVELVQALREFVGIEPHR